MDKKIVKKIISEQLKRTVMRSNETVPFSHEKAVKLFTEYYTEPNYKNIKLSDIAKELGTYGMKVTRINKDLAKALYRNDLIEENG